MAIKVISGFDTLYIRDVPPGAVLNSQNADQYRLVFSGSYLSHDRQLLIQPEANDEWSLHPNTQASQKKFINKWSTVKGPLDFILQKVKEYYV